MVPAKSIEAELLLPLLGKSLEDPALSAGMAALGLAPSSALRLPKSGDDFSADVTAQGFGVGLNFQLGAPVSGVSRVVLSDIFFRGIVFSGGPPFSGKLPRGIEFSDSRAGVRKILGEPTWTAMLPNDRWEYGDHYMTLEFAEDEQTIYMVTCGRIWTL
jgi:hypothetical protein